MRAFKKKRFPTDNVRRFLEPGPIVLISSAHRAKRDVMTCGWHMIMPFVFEVVRAHIATLPRYPTTVHYRGEGVFMISGRNVSHRRRFKPENLN